MKPEKNVLPDKKRTGLTIWMIIAQVLAVASLGFWLLVAGLSFMAFDSGDTAQAWTIIIVVWSYPLLPLALSIAAWVAYARRKNILAGVLAGLTFAPPLLLFLVMLIGNLSWFALNGA
jgi:hypothetical protein